MKSKGLLRNIALRLLLASVFALLGLYGFQINSIDSVAYFENPGLFTLLTAIFYVLILCIDKLMEMLERSGGIVITNRIIFIASIVILTVWVFIWLATFPGLAIYDGPTQLWQFKEGQISTHHPYIHTLFLYMCDRLSEMLGIEDYSFFNAAIQLLLQWLCYIRLLFVMKKFNCRPVFMFYTFFFMAVYPINAFLPLTTTKDAIFLDFFLLFMCEIALLYIEDEPQDNKWIWVRMTILAVMMSVFRNNAVYAFAVSFPFVLCISKKIWKRAAVVYVTTFIAFFLYSFFISDVLRIPGGDPREAMSAIIQPISRIYNSVPGELSEDEKYRIRRMFGGKEDVNYISYCSDYSKIDFDSGFFMEEFSENMKLYFSLFKRYPTGYLDALLATNLGNYYPLESLPRKLKVYYEIPLTDSGHSLFPAVYRFIAEFAWNSSYRNSYIITAWLNSGTTLWRLLYLIYMIVRRKDYRVLALCMLPVMTEGTLLLAAGTVMRYTQPITVCIPLILTVIISRGEKEEKE